MARILGAIVRFRYPILLVLAAINAWGDAGVRLDRVSDFHLFEGPGTALVTGQWDEIYFAPWLQVGPLTLVIGGLVAEAARISGASVTVVFAVATYVALSFGTVFVVRHVYRRTGRTMSPVLDLPLGVLVIVAGIPMMAVVAGQPSEVIIPFFWVLAARDAADDRPLRAGTWIAVAAAFKLWGILAIPLVLAVPGTRRKLIAAVVAGLGALAVHLPFLGAGWADTFSWRWIVRDGSLVGLFVEPGSPFPWELRVVQAVLSIAVGALAVVKLRSKASLVWVAPLAIVLARLATDPLLSGYYWLAAAVLAVIGVGISFPQMRTSIKVGSIVAVMIGTYAVLLPSVVSMAVRFAVFGVFLWMGATLPERSADPEGGASLYPSAEPV